MKILKQFFQRTKAIIAASASPPARKNEDRFITEIALSDASKLASTYFSLFY